MAKIFKTKDVKYLVNKHKDILKNLRKSIDLEKELQNQIKLAVNKMVTSEVLKVLRDVPVEEINREKRGIKIKALKEGGYLSIADLATASVHQIASVRGISEDTAYTIRQIVKELVNQTRKNTKIKINVDNKTIYSTELISAISRYSELQPLIATAKKLYDDNVGKINSSIADLESVTGTLKWLFASEYKKKNATEAFNYLHDMLLNGYEGDALYVINTINSTIGVGCSDVWEEFKNNSIQFYSIIEEFVPDVLGSDDVVYGLPEELAREIQDQCIFPDGLLCTLRRYQEWGVKYILHQEKVLLGDEMGLGKTIQAIATMVSLKNVGATHFIVVCPASVITNWCREISKKSKLKVIKIHGIGRNEALKSWIQTGGVAVTTYETTSYIKLEDNFSYSLCVVDEAHYIKNANAQRTINVKNICEKAERLLFMTGTALENKVEEMVALIDILQPQIALNIRDMTYMAKAPQFREQIAPVYYRRKREDVLTELPELIENKEWCTLTPEEEAKYEETVLMKNYAEVRRVSWNISDIKKSSKAKRMMELIEEAEIDGRKIIVFSFFLDTIAKVCQLLGDKCLNPINGSVTPQRRQEIIDEFDAAPAGTVLAAQIQSGGTGLNIQSASVVIICEPQFKPSIENQAISRAYRMGQARNVLVYRLLCENTVDERITDMLSNKQSIFNAFADKSVAVSETEKLEIGDAAFGDIIKNEIERIKKKNSEKRRPNREEFV